VGFSELVFSKRRPRRENMNEVVLKPEEGRSV
jgi:hypothetical protein